MMNCKTIIPLLGIGLLLSACNTPQSDRSASLPEWKPNIDQPIRQLEETLEKLHQQQPMNYTISNLAFLYDTKLYILFHEFVARLTEAAIVEEVAAQRQWLARRKTLVDAAYSQYEGGTLASYTAGRASIKATKKRIAEIEKKIKELPTRIK